MAVHYLYYFLTVSVLAVAVFVPPCAVVCVPKPNCAELLLRTIGSLLCFCRGFCAVCVSAKKTILICYRHLEIKVSVQKPDQ